MTDETTTRVTTELIEGAIRKLREVQPELKNTLDRFVNKVRVLDDVKEIYIKMERFNHKLTLYVLRGGTANYSTKEFPEDDEHIGEIIRKICIEEQPADLSISTCVCYHNEGGELDVGRVLLEASRIYP